MLAELCLTPLESRTALIEHYLAEPALGLTPDLTGARVNIARLHKQDSPVTPETVMFAMGAKIEAIERHSAQQTIVALTEEESDDLGYQSFKSLDETSWVRLTSICDRFVLANSSSSSTEINPHALLYKMISRLALDTTADPALRTNAYLFLRTQNQHVSSPVTFLNFATFICSNENPKALAILLLDPYFPENGLQTLTATEKASIELNFSEMIEWIKTNNANKNTIETIMRRFAVLETPLMTMQLIALGLDATCTMETLRNIMSVISISMISKEDDPLFLIFQLDSLLSSVGQTYFQGQIIPRILEAFDEVTELRDARIASEVFSVFIAPGLRDYPDYLLPIGQRIFSESPRLLQDFSLLISSMPLTPETFEFMLQVIDRLARDWTPSSEEDIPEQTKQDIKQEVSLNIENKYKEQFEKFFTDYGFEDRDEAKREFPDFAFREQTKPIVDEMNAASKHAAEQKLRPIFSALTTKNDYSAIEDQITRLTNHPDLQIQEYYASASTAFKLLPEVTMKMQLYCFENPNTEPAIVAEALDYAKRFHESGASLTSDSNNYRLLGSKIAYRIYEDEGINRPQDPVNQATRFIRKSITTLFKQHLVHGKDAKMPVLRYILQHLMKYGAFVSAHTPYPDAPFIWSIYADAYLPVKAQMKGIPLSEEERQYTLEKMAKVNIWLKEQILETESAPETQVLLTLPLALRLAIFANTDIDPETLKAKVVTSQGASLFSFRGAAAGGSSTTPSNTSLGHK